MLRKVECEELTFDEIAQREGKPVKAIYDRYENAKRKAREVGIKLRLSPPPKNYAKVC